MATIKSHTDLSQSKKLAEILPLDSADMSWVSNGLGKPFARTIQIKGDPEELCACWSLAALLSVLPREIVHNKNIVFLEFHVWENSFEYVNNADYTLCITESYDNPIDACVEMILKLHELNLL